MKEPPTYKPGDRVTSLPGCDGDSLGERDLTSTPNTDYIVNRATSWDNQYRLRLPSDDPDTTQCILGTKYLRRTETKAHKLIPGDRARVLHSPYKPNLSNGEVGTVRPTSNATHVHFVSDGPDKFSWCMPRKHLEWLPPTEATSLDDELRNEAKIVFRDMSERAKYALQQIQTKGHLGWITSNKWREGALSPCLNERSSNRIYRATDAYFAATKPVQSLEDELRNEAKVLLKDMSTEAQKVIQIAPKDQLEFYKRVANIWTLRSHIEPGARASGSIYRIAHPTTTTPEKETTPMKPIKIETNVTLIDNDKPANYSADGRSALIASREAEIKRLEALEYKTQETLDELSALRDNLHEVIALFDAEYAERRAKQAKEKPEN